MPSLVCERRPAAWPGFFWAPVVSRVRLQAWLRLVRSPRRRSTVPQSQRRHPPIRRSKKSDGDTVGTVIVVTAIANATVPRRNADSAPHRAERRTGRALAVGQAAEFFWRLAALGRGLLLAPRADPIDPIYWLIYWLSGRLFPAGAAPVVAGGVDA
jgi:hypothetical protein